MGAAADAGLIWEWEYRGMLFVYGLGAGLAIGVFGAWLMHVVLLQLQVADRRDEVGGGQ